MARAAVRDHARIRHGVGQDASDREHRRRTRPIAAAPVRSQDGRAHRDLDPRESRAHPGRDVLPLAGLGPHRRAAVHARARATGCPRRARS
jgi:hypothetical protein